MRELRTSTGYGARPQRRVARFVQGSGRGVLYHPIGDGVQSFRGHGLLNAAVFGGRARRAVLEEVVQARQFRGLKILVAAVLQGFLDFREILLRSDLKILFTIESEYRTQRLLQRRN